MIILSKYFIFIQLLITIVTFSSAQIDPDCGIQKPKLASQDDSTNRRSLGIVGGVEAQPHEFPWLVSLGYHDSDGNYKHGCVGSLLNAQWILSSAECWGISGKTNPSALISVHNINDGQGKNGQIKVPIQSYHKHPAFHFRMSDHILFNDIGVVKLQYAVNSSDAFKPLGPWGTICLPKADSTYNGNLGNKTTVAGWGWTVPGRRGSGSPVLQKLENFPVVSSDWCKEKYSIETQEDANTIVCTYLEGKDTCVGDSGAPLMVQENGRWTVVGITSFGQGCAQSGWPGASSHVSLYIDWILWTIQF